MRSTPLGHGAYDLTVLDEKLFGKQVSSEEIEKVIFELNKSEYWIPAFPNDGRASNGCLIMGVLLFWVSVFLILGGIHQVMGTSSILVTACVLLLAYIAAKGAYYWAQNPIGDEYLMKREKAFIDIAERFNSENAAKSFKIEVGQYGAYIALRFSTPVKQLGSMLMNYQRTYKHQKEEDISKNHHEDALL